MLNDDQWVVMMAIALALLAIQSIANAHDLDPAVLNSFGWGNNPHWLTWICNAQGRGDCWT
jgi:hypothetical protein